MPRNVEIKARVRNLEDLLSRAQTASGGSGQVLDQNDVFFSVNQGRLKLRDQESSDGKESWLIFYERPDGDGPRLSQYEKCPVSDSKGLISVLGKALGTKGEVKKKRHLFLAGQTRIHVDTVEGLGSFMELEVCLTDDQTEEMGDKIAKSLMEKLNIVESDLVTVAYTDLLEVAGTTS